MLLWLLIGDQLLCFWLCYIFFLADDIYFSVQSPVLVNRGWVPRSWRDRALQSLKDVEEARDVHSPTSLHVDKHSFWRFWSKKPEKSEVGLRSGLV